MIKLKLININSINLDSYFDRRSILDKIMYEEKPIAQDKIKASRYNFLLKKNNIAIFIKYYLK